MMNLIVILTLAVTPVASPEWSRPAGSCVVNDTLEWRVGPHGSVKRVLYMMEDFVVLPVPGFKQEEWDFNDVSFPDETHGWIVGQKRCGPDSGRGIVLMTYNAGDTWVLNYSSGIIAGTPDSLMSFTKVRMLKIGYMYQGYLEGGGGALFKWDPIHQNWRRRRPNATPPWERGQP